MKLKFEKRLASGAFGTVWQATDETISRVCAVKFFDRTPTATSDEEAIAHATQLAKVSHPAIVQIYAVEPLPNPETRRTQLAIVMEYVDGPTLDSLRGSVSEAYASAVAKDLCDAVEVMHLAEVVHRDLSAANVILTASGAKVIDLYSRGTQLGERELHRSRTEDLRDLAARLREVWQWVDGVDGDILGRAAALASQGATSVHDVRVAFAELVPEFRAGHNHASTVPREERQRYDAPAPGRYAFQCCRWTASGDLLLWCNTESLSGAIFLWSPRLRRQLGARRIHRDGNRGGAVRTSANGLVAFSSYEHLAVCRMPELLPIFHERIFVVYDMVSPNPGGTRLAWASVYGNVTLATPTGTVLHSAQVHTPHAGYGKALKWGGDELLSVTSEEGFAQIWSADGHMLFHLSSEGDGARDVIWWPDAQRFAQVGAGSLEIRETSIFSIHVARREIEPKPIYCGAAAGRHLAVAHGTSLDVWDIGSAGDLLNLAYHEERSGGFAGTEVRFDDAAQRLAVAADGRLRIHSLTDGVVAWPRQFDLARSRIELLEWIRGDLCVVTSDGVVRWIRGDGVEEHFACVDVTGADLNRSTGELAIGSLHACLVFDQQRSPQALFLEVRPDGAECVICDEQWSAN